MCTKTKKGDATLQVVNRDAYWYWRQLHRTPEAAFPERWQATLRKLLVDGAEKNDELKKAIKAVNQEQHHYLLLHFSFNKCKTCAAFRPKLAGCLASIDEKEQKEGRMQKMNSKKYTIVNVHVDRTEADYTAGKEKIEMELPRCYHLRWEEGKQFTSMKLQSLYGVSRFPQLVVLGKSSSSSSSGSGSSSDGMSNSLDVVNDDASEDVMNDEGGKYFPWEFMVNSVEEESARWMDEPSLILFTDHLHNEGADTRERLVLGKKQDGSNKSSSKPDDAEDKKLVELKQCRRKQAKETFEAFAIEAHRRTQLRFYEADKLDGPNAQKLRLEMKACLDKGEAQPQVILLHYSRRMYYYMNAYVDERVESMGAQKTVITRQTLRDFVTAWQEGSNGGKGPLSHMEESLVFAEEDGAIGASR
jgi:hypothetical protein